MSNILSDTEKRRYSKQISLSNIGLLGQEKLKKAKVLVIGAGGLGGQVLQQLAAVGVGTLGVSDDYVIEEVNLPRQTIYSDNNVGKLKTVVARQKLKEQNSEVIVNIHNIFIKEGIASNILSAYDIIVECTDNIEAKYLVNDISIKLQKPLVFGSIYKNEGQVSVFNYNNGPSYRCFYPENTDKIIPIASQTGIFSPITGIIGTLQAIEVIKIILEEENVLSGKLLYYNALKAETYKIDFNKNPFNFSS